MAMVSYDGYMDMVSYDGVNSTKLRQVQITLLNQVKKFNQIMWTCFHKSKLNTFVYPHDVMYWQSKYDGYVHNIMSRFC